MKITLNTGEPIHGYRLRHTAPLRWISLEINGPDGCWTLENQGDVHTLRGVNTNQRTSTLAIKILSDPSSLTSSSRAAAENRVVLRRHPFMKTYQIPQSF